MAKSKPFTEEDLLKMGCVEIAPNVFKRTKTFYIEGIRFKELVGTPIVLSSKTALFCEDVKASISPAVSLDQVLTIEIPGIVPGLNGDKGLMRSHWSETKKMKKLYSQIIKDQLPCRYRFEGAVSIEYVGYKSSLMDWDNFAASAKFPLDSLVKCGVIKDDNPKIVKEFIPKQVKVCRAKQRVVVIIKNYKE